MPVSPIIDLSFVSKFTHCVVYLLQVGTIDLAGSHIECSRKWVKTKGFSPDAFMQMAIQLAYFTKYGR